MTGHDDFDRTLAGWFEADALSPAPAGGLDRVLDATRRRRPRPAWLAGPGSHWVGEARDAGSSSGAALAPAPGSALVDGAHPAVGDRGPRGWGDPGRSPTVPALAAADRSPRPPCLRPRRRHLRGRLGRQEPGPDRGRRFRSRRRRPGRVRQLLGRGTDVVARRAASRLSGRLGCQLSGTPGGDNVYLSDPAGHVVASFPGTGWLVSWSPDSTRVATWVDLGQTIGIYGLDGVRQALLTVPLGYEVHGDYDPVWSPDGMSLLMPIAPVAPTSPSEVWKLPIDGGAPRRVPSEDPRSHCDAAYSRDGARMAFIAYPDSASLVIAKADGTELRVLAGA